MAGGGTGVLVAGDEPVAARLTTTLAAIDIAKADERRTTKYKARPSH